MEAAPIELVREWMLAWSWARRRRLITADDEILPAFHVLLNAFIAKHGRTPDLLELFREFKSRRQKCD